MYTVSVMLVEMERSYVTAGFFRHTMYHRSNKIKQQLAISAAAAEQQVVGRR
jgi:dynamin GTPase